MMKKLLVLTLVLALLAATTIPALAAGGPPTDNGPKYGSTGGSRTGTRPLFALAGTIAGVDPVARTITVTVVAGNWLAHTYIGQDLLILTSETTRFLSRNIDGTATPITFEDLAVGQNVSVTGLLSDTSWTAERITVGAELSCP